MWLLLVLIAWPLVEIGLFVEVGGWIGLWPTLAWVLGTAVAGVMLLRRQGAQAMAGVAAAMNGLRDPGRPLADGALAMTGAVLLILPGFLTDVLGLALLLSPVRALLLRALPRDAARARARADAAVIEVEYRDVTPRNRTDDPHP